MPPLLLDLGLMLPPGGCESLIRATALHPSQVLFKFFAPCVGLALAFLSETPLIRPHFFYCSYILSEFVAPRARRLACLAFLKDLSVQSDYASRTQGEHRQQS